MNAPTKIKLKQQGRKKPPKKKFKMDNEDVVSMNQNSYALPEFFSKGQIYSQEKIAELENLSQINALTNQLNSNCIFGGEPV